MFSMNSDDDWQWDWLGRVLGLVVVIALLAAFVGGLRALFL
jgi:uncharacterized membrane protein